MSQCRQPNEGDAVNWLNNVRFLAVYENLAFCLEMFVLTLFNLWSYRRPLSPAIKMTELENPSFNKDANDLHLQNIKAAPQGSTEKEIDHGKPADAASSQENNVDLDLRSSAIVKISSSVSVVEEDKSTAKWLPAITRSWNVNMDSGLIKIHRPSNGRGETTVQNVYSVSFLKWLTNVEWIVHKKVCI